MQEVKTTKTGNPESLQDKDPGISYAGIVHSSFTIFMEAAISPFSRIAQK